MVCELNTKHIHVACAIIERDGLVLAAQRSSVMSLPLKGNFPAARSIPAKAQRYACNENWSRR